MPMHQTAESGRVPAQYPTRGTERNRWIVSQRTARHTVNPFRPHGCFVELERFEGGDVLPVATILLTNRECPWKCVMCDLWKTTLPEPVPRGAVVEQIRFALSLLNEPQISPTSRDQPNSDPDSATRISPTAAVARPKQIKLYNGGSFFDPLAIPPQDYEGIAACVSSFDRVIVECHPAFVGDRTLAFQRSLKFAARGTGLGRDATRLEVGIGLETAHPETLQRLNKRMTLDQFRHAAAFLRHHEIALRVFLLVTPPFLGEAEGAEWAQRSIDVAFDAGATVVSLVPTRGGNGAMEALRALGEFSEPSLATLESVHSYGIRTGRGRVFADLWDLERFSRCTKCFPARRARLERINHEQLDFPRVACDVCDSSPSPRHQPPR